MEPDSLSFLTLITKLRVIPRFTFGVRCSEKYPANFEIKSQIGDEFQISRLCSFQLHRASES